ncbi:MAG: chemotaxis protein CheD [Sulfuriferula sp.]|nr:chemotaxis protein CheD [Sulfuriferula sp.]
MKKLPQANAMDIFLQPGEFYFGDRHTRIRTILGSCVSITMWHPHKRIGGMCHYMLPSRGKKAGKKLDGKYADEALQLFLHEIRAAGTWPEEYQVKLFGGGSMFPKRGNTIPVPAETPEDSSNCRDVPCRNRQSAYQLIQHYGFTLMAEHLGGSGHRQLMFDIATGDAWVRQNPITTTGTDGTSKP